jgi:16S rRNA (adenine1518-N6/adenine1519-N6)-dimethyltransferase
MKISTKKSLGQNFLINKGVLNKIINAAELNNSDVVLEVGPGTGILTEKLAEKADKVIAVEKDCRLIEFLKNKFSTKSAEINNRHIAAKVEIVEGDILKDFDILKYQSIKEGKYKIIGNIPYYLTSRLLRIILSSEEENKKISENQKGGKGSEIKTKWPKPNLIVLMVQKEVAQRIMAKPPHMNLLALTIQFYAKPEIISYVSRGSFQPMPKVDSAIIRLTPMLKTDPEKIIKVINLAKKAFSKKRKQLKNSIGQEILKKSNINLNKRPQELSPDEWLKIVTNY